MKTSMSLSHIILLLCGGILAGIVDTIIGGGGLFSVPTLLFTGLSPQATLGTNQFALSFGSLVGTFKFNQKGNIKWFPETLICIIGALPGTVLGSLTSISIPPNTLHTIVICLLIVIGIVTIMKGNITDGIRKPQSASWIRVISILLLGIGIGFYEGFFGPGSGLIIVFAFVTWFGFSYVEASGSAKAVSLFGNITAFITFALNKDVHWTAGLILACTVSIGAYVGAFVAQRGGRKVIRPVMLGVIVLLVGDVLTSFFPHNLKF